MRKKICLGGSFNPIHLGHLICARAAMEAVGAEGVLLFPTGQSPHKLSDPEVASAEHRAAMCRAATMDLAAFEIDDRETRHDGPSYTIQTARELRAQGWHQVNWLIGADLLSRLHTWHEADALIEEVNFIVMARPGFTFDWNSMPVKFQHQQNNVVQVPQIDISSTEIRGRVRAGKPIDLLTPTAVCRYIEAKKLYR
jgi:nicotinate-nucleotide adenylyltransferase